MKIHLYTLCWNEEVILPHFLKHYSFVDKMIVYDNQSDDRSLEILKAEPKVEVRTFDTSGQHHTGELDRIRNQAWVESKGQADFVIVCDTDEFLYHSDLPALLEAMKESGATLLKPHGYEMLGDRPPLADENIFDLYPKGVRTYSFDKCVLFDPNAIEKIAYQPGSHVCEPTGRVVLFRRPGLALLHFRHLGVEYVRRRYEACAARRSDFNREKHFGTHYLESEESTRRRFDKISQAAGEVFANRDIPQGKAAFLQVPENFDKSIFVAAKAMEEDEFGLAIKELEYILSFDPGHVLALTKLSVALRKSGRDLDAGYALKQAVALDPDRPDLWFTLAEIAAGLRSEKVAINSYQRAICLRPDFYRAHLGLATVYQVFKQPKSAVGHYQRAIELKPRMSEPYRQWGGMAYKLKRYKVALQIYETWLKWDGQNASALNAYALVLKAQGRTDEALEKFKQALLFDPESLAVLNNLGTLLHISGRLEEGVTYFRRALDLEPENALLKTNLANVLLDLGQVDEAAELNQCLVDDKIRNSPKQNEGGA